MSRLKYLIYALLIICAFWLGEILIPMFIGENKRVFTGKPEQISESVLQRPDTFEANRSPVADSPRVSPKQPDMAVPDDPSPSLIVSKIKMPTNSLTIVNKEDKQVMRIASDESKTYVFIYNSREKPIAVISENSYGCTIKALNTGGNIIGEIRAGPSGGNFRICDNKGEDNLKMFSDVLG
ncbi:MAG: hypothetical protein J7M18_02760, partial [Candidatus Eremiobacteraeota bacterium]|nr:hypothetical protein [Candidatus Eremiobacteraeota bacterium]